MGTLGPRDLLAPLSLAGKYFNHAPPSHFDSLPDASSLGYRNILPVDQSHWAFSTKEQPVLAIWGLYDCVGLIAHVSRAQIAFIAHSDSISFPDENTTSERKSIHVQKLYDGLQKRFGIFKLDITIAKGCLPNLQFIEIIRRDLATPPSNIAINQITEIDVSPGAPSAGSVAIDSRTGKLNPYNPRLNPYHNYYKNGE